MLLLKMKVKFLSKVLMDNMLNTKTSFLFLICFLSFSIYIESGDVKGKIVGKKVRNKKGFVQEKGMFIDESSIDGSHAKCCICGHMIYIGCIPKHFGIASLAGGLSPKDSKLEHVKRMLEYKELYPEIVAQWEENARKDRENSRRRKQKHTTAKSLAILADTITGPVRKASGSAIARAGAGKPF